MSLQKTPNFWRNFTATQPISIGSQSGGWEVEEHANLLLLCRYHIVIWSELKYLIGAKVLHSRKWGSAVCWTRPDIRGLMPSPGNDPTKAQRVGIMDGSGTEPNQFSGSNPDLLLILVLSAGRLTVCLYIERPSWIIHAILWCWESSDWINAEYNRQNAVWLGNAKNHYRENMVPTLLLSCAEVSAAFVVSCRPARWSQVILNFIILEVKYRRILSAPPYNQVLPSAAENALAESERTLLSSRGACEHLDVHRCTGKVDRIVWEVRM